MTKILVVSDTHGSYYTLRQLVLYFKNDVSMVLHCGDGEGDVQKLMKEFPDLPVFAVCGNCDFASGFPKDQVIDVENHRIFMTHGHHYYVGFGMTQLIVTARNNGADIVLFGHTHYAETHYEDGIYLMNPGSPARPRDCGPSFGILDVGKAGVMMNLMPYERKKYERTSF